MRRGAIAAGRYILRFGLAGIVWRRWRRERIPRITAALLAVWYAGVASHVLFFVLDRIAPLTLTVSQEDFPCADHHCGCKTAEQCRTHCCCYPQKAARAAGASCEGHESQNEPVRVAVSYFSALTCLGKSPGDDGAGLKKIAPHVLPERCRAIAFGGEDAICFAQAQPSCAFADTPEKIPI